MTPTILPVNETNVIIYFSDSIDPGLTATISAVVKAIAHLPGEMIVDLTPSYSSLLVTFNPLRTNAGNLVETLENIVEQNRQASAIAKTRLVEIPVWYSPKSGLDLEDTAALIGVSTGELIDLHSKAEYMVFALGFLPGFAFMGVVEEPLVLPRLSTPRAKVPPGSVAIAEKQTAVYPAETPGGWRLLGRSPLCLFDSECDPPIPYQVGDRIRFVPIDKTEYLAMGGAL